MTTGFTKLVTASGCALVLLFVEGMVRSDWFSHADIAANASSIKARWLTNEQPATVLILGDSSGHRGLDASVMSQVSELRTLNGAFTSGSPIVMGQYFKGLPWKPSQVLVALTPLLLSDNWQTEPHEVDFSTIRERLALQSPGDAILGSVWMTFRKRHNLKALVERFGTGRSVVREEADDAFGSLQVVSDSVATAEMGRALWVRWGGTRTPRRGVRLQRMLALASEWQKQGIEVTYVLMPASSGLRSAAAEFGGWTFQTDALEEITHKYGGRTIDCREALPDQAFYDADHLKAGPYRTEFSKLLSSLLVNGQGDCHLVVK